MRRYLGLLSYQGDDYFGYQIQNNQKTIQGVLESSLSTVLRSEIKTKGSSRTDTGVHALCNSFHFDFEDPLPEMFLKRINGILPKDISLLEIKEVDVGFHARFSAIERTYIYKVHLKKDPFLNGRSWLLFGESPDFEKMHLVAQSLLEYNDFACFSKLNSGAKTTICKIKSVGWEKINDHQYLFSITGDRFLRGMVRAIVATLMKVGKSAYDENCFRSIIERKSAEKTDFSAPPHGLYLQNVVYEGI